ncbi:50S ribosomal protein L18 [Candidatus Parcubacteria bacterium]|nr:50S ribosomal protein L18 [Candidatus Parcubacteria bacterium]
MNKQKAKQYQRSRRRGRVRAKVSGTSKCPRLSVFRSNKGMYLQLIDDEKSKTLVSVYNKEVPSFAKATEGKSSSVKATEGKSFSIKATEGKSSFAKATEDKGKKVVVSFELGKLVAKKALDKKIKKVIFDRGGYKYHGRIKAVADGAREGGLKF